MKRRSLVAPLLSTTLVAGLLGGVASAATPGGLGASPPSPPIAFAPISRYDTGLGVGAAEIVAHEADHMYVVNAVAVALDIVDVSQPASPSLIRRVDLSSYGGGVNSVAVKNGVVAVAVEADPKTDQGSVVFMTSAGTVTGVAAVGAQPDALAFTPDGKRVVTANEGEPSDDYTIDPPGTISIITVAPFARGGNVPPRAAVRTVGFTEFDGSGPRSRPLPDGVRIFGPNATVSEDLEPEYVTISPDSRTAWVTLQENNALAIIDLNRAGVREIVPLGLKDHSVSGFGLDPSDRDGAIATGTWPVKGMYQPDAISAFTARGATYLVTANEGDARDWGGYAEEVRVGSSSVELDSVAFPNASDLKQSGNLGRLTISRATGDLDGDDAFEELHVFGARSFSIWAADGELVWDSGDELEQITAAAHPATFNSNNSSTDFDTRSDNKGPEPEAVATGVVGGRTYAFVGMERVGGLVVYDVTTPQAPRFIQYTNPRDFALPESEVGPDSGPEDIKFIDRASSPSGRALLLVANEVTGTVTIYEERDPNGASELTLLHNNDGESSLLPFGTTVASNEFEYGGVAAFASVVNRELRDARAGFRSTATVYAGDAFLASSTLACSLPPQPADTPIYDAVAQRQIPYDAHVIGNHEFDFSPDFLERFIRSFEVNGVLTQPFLSANLDFTGEAGFAGLLDADGLRVGYSTDGRVVARSLLHADRVTGDRFGVVAITTPALPTISSPRNVLVTSDNDASTAAIAQAEIDRLRDDWGVTKVIFVSHLQGIANDLALIPLLRHVDVAVAGGGDELLTSPGDVLLPGESQSVFGTYPLPVVDGDGRTVYVVTTSGNYKYVGRLDVAFDAAGEVSAIDADASGPVRVIPDEQPSATTLSNLDVTDAVTPDPAIVESVVEPVAECLEALDEPIATTEVLINVSNPAATRLGFTVGVRNGETNGGNLVADSYIAAYDTYAASFGLPARGGATKVVAVQNGGGIRQNAGPVLPTDGIAPGPITRRNTFDVMAFLTNIVTVVPDVKPADLKLILERSVSAAPANQGRFLQLGGMSIVYDPTATAHVVTNPPLGSPLQYGTIITPGNRVRSVTLADGTPVIANGAVVDGAPNVTIVTNNFTAIQGGDNYPTFVAQPTKIVLPLTYEQALVDYLLSFPVGSSGLPTIPASDSRYAAPGGEGRITVPPAP